jgi:hypothetical protein
MFHTDLSSEYTALQKMGLSESEIRQIAQASFTHALDLGSETFS